MTPIGRRDARITIERATVTLDAQGSPVETWATLATVWAQAQSINSKETTEGNARAGGAETVFSIRYQSALAQLNPRDRINWSGTIYDIASALPLPPSRPSEIIITGVWSADQATITADVVNGFTYLMPDGGSIFQPDGASLYLQPDPFTYLMPDGGAIFQPDGASLYLQP